MNTQLRYYLILFFLFATSLAIKTQENLTVTGGNIQNDNGFASISIGQLFYSHNESNSGSETQGVQQTFEINVITNIDAESAFEIKAFPNPVQNSLSLQVNPSSKKLHLKIYSIDGILLMTTKIKGEQTTIDFQNFPASTYFMHIQENSKEIKCFKIVKTK